MSVTQLTILTKETKPLNSRQYPTSLPPQQGRLNKREAESSSDQGLFHSHRLSHRDWRQQKEAGDPNTRALHTGTCLQYPAASRWCPWIASSRSNYCNALYLERAGRLHLLQKAPDGCTVLLVWLALGKEERWA